MVVKCLFVKGNIKSGFVEVRIPDECASLDTGVWTVKIGSFVAYFKESVNVLCGITLNLLKDYHFNENADSLSYKPTVIKCVHIKADIGEKMEVMNEMVHVLHFTSGNNVIKLGLLELQLDTPLQIDADIYATLIVERVV